MISIVVVTYNRRALLERCLLAIKHQSYQPNRVYVIDNASTDGTQQWLGSWLPEHLPNAELVALPENRGGAGGFSEGLRTAIEKSSEWVWMMDDDAEPHQDALKHLMSMNPDAANVYGSLAVSGDNTSWPTFLTGYENAIFKTSEVPEYARVEWIPFLGFMIHRDLASRIGMPDVGYFIAADDVEYCLRAKEAGAKFIIAGLSRIEHPKAAHYVFRIPGRYVGCLRLAPWKRYYDTRNRLFIARKYYGFKLYTQTIPGSFIRLLAALVHEPQRLAQLWAFTAGMVDGLIGLKGRRHQKWGIPQ